MFRTYSACEVSCISSFPNISFLSRVIKMLQLPIFGCILRITFAICLCSKWNYSWSESGWRKRAVWWYCCLEQTCNYRLQPRSGSMTPQINSRNKAGVFYETTKWDAFIVHLHIVYHLVQKDSAILKIPEKQSVV